MDSPSKSTQSAGPTNRGVRVGLIVGVIVLLALFAFGEAPRLHNSSRLAAQAQDVSNGIVDVSIVAPLREKPSDLTLPGNIQAIDEAVVNSRSSGYLQKRFVDIGSKVHAGDVLAVIESPDLDQQVYQAAAQTDQSKATVRVSQADVARQIAGVAQSEATVAQQRAAVRQAQAMLASAESKKSQAEAAEAQSEAAYSHSQHALEQQRAALKQSETQLDLAKVTNERYQSMLKQGFDSQQDADQTAAAVKNSAAAVASASAGVASAQSDVDAARQAVNATKAAVISAQADIDASKESVEAVKSALASSQAVANASRASVAVSRSTVQANQAAVSSSQANTQHYAVLKSFERVVAPFDGIITSRNVDVGALIAGGGSGAVGSSNGTTPSNGLFGIARTNTLRIQVNVPQTFVDFVRPGVPAQIAIAEQPRRVFQGKVFQSAGALDAASRTLLTEVQVANNDNALRPGMYAQVRFHNPRTNPVITVPGNTLIINAGGNRLAVVANGKVHFVDVKIGRDFGNKMEIVRGLVGNEQVIVNPTDDLQEGQEVHATLEAPAKKP